jgi:hypothetical protein
MLTPLAQETYRQLLRHLRTGKASITYAELAAAVSKKQPTHQRSPSFHAALGEVTAACRATGLPCLPAIVWRAAGGRPGSGYYPVAHPRARTDRSRREAWEHEHADVMRDAAKFPPTL